MLFMGLLLMLVSPLMSTHLEKGSCGPPPETKNGKLRGIKEKYSPGHIVYYKCLPGYTLGNQANYATCRNSQWTDPPTCRGINQVCGPPPTVLHGEIKDRQSDYRSGSSVTYECAHLHTLDGNKIITCRDGEWEKEPICREPCTLSEAAMQKNNIEQRHSFFFWSNKKYLEHSEMITFTCLPKYQASYYRPLTVQCLDGEIEYPICLKQGQCDDPNIAHAIFTPKQEDGYDSGSSVDVECEEPYGLAGPKDIKCTNSQWSELPQCLQPCSVYPHSLEENHIELQSPDDIAKVHKHDTEINIKCRLRFYSPEALQARCDDGIIKYTKCFIS